ncbi:vomeronasal type-2 receptor 26-like [Ambystoma mexicanum]|uniref:vomeronasal type-2 receptor 26-like n=1 Tax=Ambystoma mexicanum TaxID=8296 RepID=UPI0037E749E4
MPKLPEETRLAMDQPLTTDELAEVIKDLVSNKDPGLDGLGAEFYKEFSADLVPLLLQVWVESLQCKILPPSMREAQITVLPKPRRPPQEMSSYRPLSLINTDAKIFAKVLASRLLPAVPTLDHPDQNGFIPTRSTALNLCRLFGIMAQIDPGRNAVAISLDAEKAFDSVSWAYLLAVLEAFGVDPNFIRYVELLYTEHGVRVLTNQSISDLFLLGRGTSANIRYFRHILAFIYATEEINRNPELLPNLTLGYHIYDSCSSVIKALRGTLSILSGTTTPVPNYSCRRKDRLAGFIGDLSSATSYRIAQLAGIYKYPQISFGAQYSIFSDEMRFPSFYRMVPSEYSLFSVITQLLKHFRWTWVGIVTSGDESGERGLRGLQNAVDQSGGCVEFSIMLPDTLSSHRKLSQITKSIRKFSAQVIILYGTRTALLSFFLNALLEDIPHKTWIIYGNTPFEEEVINESNVYIFNGTLSFSIQKGDILGFQDFLYDVNPSMFLEHDALELLWQKWFHCKLKSRNNSQSIYMSNLEFCSGNETMRSVGTYMYDVINFRYSFKVYTAVYALAQALHSMHQSDPMSGTAGSLQQELRQWKLNRFLRRIRFKTPAGYEFAFDDTEDAPAQYDILNWVFYPNGTVASFHVGTFDSSAPPEHRLFINQSKILWHPEGPDLLQIPRSACSMSCLTGYRKAPIEGKPTCCYYCVPCAEGEFANSTDMENCLHCHKDQWPNDRKNGCIHKAIIYLSNGDSLGLSLTCISVVSSVTTAAVLGIFLRHRDTPIVKANNRDLSYTLLISLMLAFLCSLLFIGRPAPLTCLIQQAAFGIIFTIAVSCVLAKTMTVIVAFNATRPASRYSRWLGSRASGFMVFLCTLGEVVICLSWLLTSPPHPHNDMQSETGKMILQCDPGSLTAFYTVIGYMGLLAFASFMVAFLARNLPDRFNEAKLITFSMLVFCSVWVSFIPAYLSTKGSYMVAVEIFAILASSSGLLGCIFLPKCYIILLRPNINTRMSLAIKG